MLAITLIMMMMMTTRELAHSSLSLYQRASGPRLSIKKKRRKKEKKYYVNSNFLNNFVKKKKISQCEADSKFKSHQYNSFKLSELCTSCILPTYCLDLFVIYFLISIHSYNNYYFKDGASIPCTLEEFALIHILQVFYDS